MRAVPRTPGAAALERARRFRSPLLLALWALLAFEGAGGLVIFFARVAYGTLPGEAIHVVAGVALTLAYAVYQWSHWTRVRPFRPRMHYALGLIAACSMALTNLTGLALGWMWWARGPGAGATAGYPPLLSALHDIGCMMTLTFILSHLGAVLARDRRARELGHFAEE
ncbi:MAG TPA: hypothetical protein VI792_02210 [Candidatus Eisenbacteria bacterium]